MLFPAPHDNHGQRRQQNTVDLAPRIACALSSSPARSGRALHCWQRCLHRLVAGYGKYWGCVPWRMPRIASLTYLHRSLPRLPLRPFPKARNPHLQRPRHPLCKKDLQARQQGCSSSSTRSTFPLLGSCATAAAQVRSMGTKGTSTRTHLECSSI